MKGTGNPADMNPNPTQATLEGGDPAGQLEEKVKVYQNNQSLMIENAQEGDSGVYSCHAQNKFGNDNIVIRLTVLGEDILDAYGTKIKTDQFFPMVHKETMRK